MSNVPDGVSQFFRRVGQYLRRGSEVAGSWIDEQAAINQRVRAIRRLRAQQQTSLTTIGAKVYALHRKGKVRNKDVLAECEHIDEILAHIARLKKEIEEIRLHSSRPEVQLMEVEDEEPLEATEEGAEEPSAEAEGGASPEAEEAAGQAEAMDEPEEEAAEEPGPTPEPEAPADEADEAADEAEETGDEPLVSPLGASTQQQEPAAGADAEDDDDPDLELWGEAEE
ncbi:MAG: hypothetical protein J7M26_09785 [Armatimonadetes bacterium]|nr:hypothetical protein [Armatimonadota bacterium]